MIYEHLALFIFLYGLEELIPEIMVHGQMPCVELNACCGLKRIVWAV